MITLQSSSYYSLYSPNLYRDNFIDIIRFTTNQILSFLPLDYPPQKRKSLSRALPPLVVLCTLYWAFCLLYLLQRGKKLFVLIIKMVIFSILPVIIPYLLLNWGLSFLRLDKVSYIYVPLCFPRTYPCCINHHSGLTVFETSNAG